MTVCQRAPEAFGDRWRHPVGLNAEVGKNHLGGIELSWIARERCRLRVAGVDMLDGTPIPDIKPYLSSVPPERLRRGWLVEAEARRRE